MDDHGDRYIPVDSVFHSNEMSSYNFVAPNDDDVYDDLPSNNVNDFSDVPNADGANNVDNVCDNNVVPPL